MSGEAAVMGPKLAIEGGVPVRASLLPYGGQWITEDDVAAVAEAARSPWLTGGAAVEKFERALSRYVGAAHVVALSSGTAALHAAMHAISVGPSDEVITSPLTFVSTANSVLFVGATPVFADVDPLTLNLDPSAVAAAISPRTRAVIAIHYGGHPCDLQALRALGLTYDLMLVEDACHALGATYRGTPIGADSEFAVFSFHPVKLITTAEGGAVACRENEAAARMRGFRSHGIRTSGREREAKGIWEYDMVDLGYNYRLTDLQCALGMRQLARAETFLARRREIAQRYCHAFADLEAIHLPVEVEWTESAWHLFPVRLRLERLRVDRDQIFAALRAEGIGVNVHYKPVHLHGYYRQRFGYSVGQFPVAEEAFRRLLTLPLFPRMTDQDVQDVITAVRRVISHYRRS